MPITVGAVTRFESASGTSVTLAVPSGTVTGDTLVAVVSHASSTPIRPPSLNTTGGYLGGYQSGYVTAAPEAGTAAGFLGGYLGGYVEDAITLSSAWTLQHSIEAPNNGGIAVAVMTRIVASGDPSSHVFPTSSTPVACSGFMIRLSGSLGSLDGASVGIASPPTFAPLTLPNTATSHADSLFLSVQSLGTTNTATPVIPTGTTQLGTTTGTGSKLTVVTEQRSNPGNLDPKTWSYTAAVAVSSAAIGLSIRASGVRATRQTSWTARVPIVAARGTLWSVGGKPTAARGTTWSVGQVVTPATRATTWAILAGRNSSRSSSWSTFQTSPVAAFSPMTRLRIYAPNGALLGTLPAPQSVNAAFPLNDIPSLTFSYLVRAPVSSFLGQPCEVAFELSPDNGYSWFEPPDGRFLYMTDGRDPLNPADRYDVNCAGYIKRLEKVLTYPNGVNAEGRREFTAKMPGAILHQLFTEAQTRGAMTGLSWTFNAATDSAGVPWTQTMTVQYDPGISALQILMNMAEQGFIDFRMVGRSIRAYNADTFLSQDRTTGSGQVNLRSGRDLTEAPFRRTWEGLADSAYFAGDQGASYQYTNPTAIKPWGRQEIYIANGEITDPGTMASITQQQLSLHDKERIEYTRGLDFTRSPHVPLHDYFVGDFVWSTVDGTLAPEKLRVRQVTFTVSDLGVLGGNVVLNDRFLEQDIRAQRRIDGITNGASGTVPLPDGPAPGVDTTTPAQVTGLQISSSAYIGTAGFVEAQVTLSWAPVTTNSDGTPADDIDHYEIYRRAQGSTILSSRFLTSSPDAVHEDSPYATESAWVFKVRAVDQSGHRGAFSGEVSHIMASDLTPPQAPSTPTAEARLGVVRFSWDGLPSVGSWERDFDYVEVHASTVNNFTPSPSTLIDRLDGAGSAVVTDGAYGVPIFGRLVAVDKGGLKSGPSGQASATPARLVGTDLDPGAITYEQIGFKDPGNVVLDGSFESEAFTDQLAGRSHAAWTITTADSYHGNASATIDAAISPGTNRNLVLMATPGDFQSIMGGEKLFCRYAYKADVGTVGDCLLAVEWRHKPGNLSRTRLDAVFKTGTWQQIAQQIPAPADAEAFRVYMQVPVSGTAGRWWVDAIEVRRTVGTSIIEDAAIKNAQIDNLAVNNAKIANLDVGKLTAGQLNADVLIAASLRTASTGNRVEMNSTGIYLYAGTTLRVHMDPAKGLFRAYGSGDVRLTSTTHAFQIGPDTGGNLIIDNNEIMSRNGTLESGLYLNKDGGSVFLGGVRDTLPDGSNIPRDENHKIMLRGAVHCQSPYDSDYGDEYPPLMVGASRGSQHLWFDSNEIGSSTGDAVGNLNIMPPAKVGGNHTSKIYIASNALQIFRMSSSNAAITGLDGPECGLQFTGTNGLLVRTAGLAGYREIHATSFVVESQADVKTDVTDIPGALDLVQATPSTMWQYKSFVEEGRRWHFGPMVDQLPEQLIDYGIEGRKGYDVASLQGVLWEAVRQLAARVAELESPGHPFTPPAPEDVVLFGPDGPRL